MKCILLLLGIFAYLNFRIPRDRKYILDTLIKGLQRLEYRGYDSAGMQSHSVEYFFINDN